MAKETAAQRNARFDAERQAQMALARSTYTQRLMVVLERSSKENFELDVKNGMFVVEDRDHRRVDAFNLSVEYSTDADEKLQDLEWAVERKEEERAESDRLTALRRQAFLKLTEEEQQALGLNDRNNW